MKQIEATLKGVTHSSENGRYDELIVTISVSSCVINGVQKDFPMPPLVRVSIEPYRMVIPLNDKYALTRNGSEVEFNVTGTLEEPKVTLAKVVERKDCSLTDFLAALQAEEK